MLIINPGSENKGGTLEQAKKNAKHWLDCIHNDGFKEVKMSFVKQHEDGDFMFNFTHFITKKVATLDIHGFTDEQCEKFLFEPRVYWQGSSCSSPKIEDWITDEYTFRIVFEKK